MVCTELFSQFLKYLTSREDTFTVTQDAFSILSDAYHIGRVSYDFKVESSPFTRGGAEANGILYQKRDEEIGSCRYEKEFHTGEGGKVRLSIHATTEIAAWTEDEEADLELVLDILFVHLGRYRMIRQTIKNSLSDFMTGLPNSDGYMRYATKLFTQHKLSLFNAYYFDLKGMGLINRKFGQKETDEIIKKYARILSDFTEGEEIVGRLGGDNFVSLIYKQRTDEFLELLSGATVYGSLAGEQVPVCIKAVAGIFEIDDKMQDCSPIISKCAVALNVAKNVTKEPYLYASDELDNEIYRQKQIAQIFPSALEHEEFVVYYQPKVETDSYQIVGAEALVRWFRDGNIISPGNFVPVIEQDSSICKLDFYMLDCVCRDIRSWIDEGIEPVRVSVNFSRKHLSTPSLSEDILAIIQKYEIPKKYIEIEVTETTDEEEQGLLSTFMNKMREYHITTAIDDFGTGYSSLNILRSFPVDVIKIDKSFIDDEEITESDRIVLTNIVRMSRELNMDVITEGVENWEQVDFLRDIQCNMVQGFLFDRPMPQIEFAKKLRMRRYDAAQVQNFQPA